MPAIPPRSLACSACGSPIQPDEKFCSACGSPTPFTEGQQAKHLPRSNAKQDATSETEQIDGSVRCGNCEALITGHKISRSMNCPFCDAAIVFELTSHSSRRPEFILGFAISHQRAQELFFHWLRKRGWFCPSDLRRKARTESHRGVYVPFWHFSALAQSKWHARIGEHWYRTESYTTRDANGKTVRRTRRVRETEWFPLRGSFSSYRFGHLIEATRGLTQREIASVSPFALTALVRFSPDHIAGWPVEEPSVPEDEALKLGRTFYSEEQSTSIRRFMPGDAQSDLTTSTEIEVTGTDLVLLPIYIWRYHYRGKTFRFIINGQSGKVHGAKPISPWRVALAILIPIVLIAGVFLAIQLLE